MHRQKKPAPVVRVSDLGLACDFSKKKPHASVGTHGYMAPEVLAKGVAYDSSADWFSLGCMLYKLLKLPNEGLSPDCRDLLEGLLKRDVPDRLGCKERGVNFRQFSYFTKFCLDIPQYWEAHFVLQTCRK
ncbi:hypothetical protein COOONC_26364 [Cooperia oncophora]